MLSLSCIRVREIKKVTYINDFLSILSITYSIEVVTKKYILQ